MRILIAGTGAMASLLGARLSRDGRHDVTLAGTWAEALARIPRAGIAVREPEETWIARPAACPLHGPLPACDVVLVLVKAWQTRAVGLALKHGLSAPAPVFTLQNGLGNREQLAGLLGWPVEVGVATVGARLDGPGEVSATGPGQVVLGRRAEPGAADALAAALTAAHTPAVTSDDIEVHVWRKLIANVAINALTALHGVTNGALLERPVLRSEFEAAALEAGAIARAQGVRLEADPVALATVVAASTAANRSSMLQDVERGAPTEIDALNGAVVEAGRRLGIPTPVNEALWRAVRLRRPLPAATLIPGGQACRS